MQHLQSMHHSEELSSSNNGVSAASRDHRGDDNRSTDSGVSTIRSVSGDERSGSRSSTVSDERNLRPSPYLPEQSSNSPPTNSSSHAQPGRPQGGAPPGVWRDPALIALHQARSAALASGKLPPHLGLHPAASMAEHHRQPSAANTAASNPAPAMTSAAATAAQFSAIQQYQVKYLILDTVGS